MNFNGKIKEKNERERVKPQTYMINIFDTHAHYDYDWFDEDREDVLAGLKERGVNRVVNIGASVKGCMDTIELVNNTILCMVQSEFIPQSLMIFQGMKLRVKSLLEV